MTKLAFFHIVTFALIVGCVESKIRLATDGKAEVYLVPWKDLSSEGESLGSTPLEVERSRVQNKMLRVKSEGRADQNWIFGTDDNGGVDLKIPLGAKIEEKSGESSTDKDNRNMRLLMAAYSKLHSGQYEKSRELAGKLITIEPEISAPHIIIGLSYLKSGNKQKASASFSQAKTLDPSDNEIDRLIEISQ